MDDNRLTERAQTLSDGLTRRSASWKLAAGVLAGGSAWLGLRGAGDAKRKKKKKQQKKRCPNSLPLRCQPTSYDPQGLCAPAGAACCAEATGGGYCDPQNPQCCPLTAQTPGGLCIPAGSVCCTSSEGGGYCDPGETCCPPGPGYPNGYCAWPGYPCWWGYPSGLDGEGRRDRKRGKARGA